jgi:type I restriction enzyme M protein
VDWKKIEDEIKDEHEQKGFNGRFGAGLPYSQTFHKRAGR